MLFDEDMYLEGRGGYKSGCFLVKMSRWIHELVFLVKMCIQRAEVDT